MCLLNKKKKKGKKRTECEMVVKENRRRCDIWISVCVTQAGHEAALIAVFSLSTPRSASGVNCTKQNTSSRPWSEFDW